VPLARFWLLFPYSVFVLTRTRIYQLECGVGRKLTGYEKNATRMCWSLCSVIHPCPVMTRWHYCYHGEDDGHGSRGNKGLMLLGTFTDVSWILDIGCDYF